MTHIPLPRELKPCPFCGCSMTRSSNGNHKRQPGDQMRESNPTEVVEVYGDDAAAATRRAIVRAAAAVAQANPIPLPKAST